MTNGPSNPESSIIIRQEVIIPACWGPSGNVVPPIVTSAPRLMSPSPAPQAAAPPCAPATKANTFRTGVNVTVIEPYFDPNSCWQVVNSKVTVRGHSSCGAGAIDIWTKCYKITDTIDLINPDMTGVQYPPISGTGMSIPGDWQIDNVPIAVPDQRNIVAAWSRFTGDDTWYFACNHFFPCPPSGSGLLLHVLDQAALSQSAVFIKAPPHRLVVELLEEGRHVNTVELYYDDYCSAPNQAIWCSLVEAGAAQMVLKVCPYGDQLIGLLAERQAGTMPRVWLSDRFNFHAENHLVQEGRPSSVFRVRSA